MSSSSSSSPRFSNNEALNGSNRTQNRPAGSLGVNFLGVKVASISSDSSALKYGVDIGDSLISVDGLPVNSDNIRDLLKGEPGEIIRALFYSEKKQVEYLAFLQRKPYSAEELNARAEQIIKESHSRSPRTIINANENAMSNNGSVGNNGNNGSFKRMEQQQQPLQQLSQQLSQQSSQQSSQQLKLSPRTNVYDTTAIQNLAVAAQAALDAIKNDSKVLVPAQSRIGTTITTPRDYNYESTNDAIFKENIQLRKKLVESEETIIALRTDNVNLRNRLDSLKREVDKNVTSYDHHLKNSATEIQALRGQRDAMQEQITKTRAEADQLHRDLEALTQQNLQEKATNGTLRKMLEEAQYSAADGMDKEFGDIRLQLEAVIRTCMSPDRNVNELQRRHTELHRTLLETIEKLREANAMQIRTIEWQSTAIEKMKDENRKLRAQLMYDYKTSFDVPHQVAQHQSLHASLYRMT